MVLLAERLGGGHQLLEPAELPANGEHVDAEGLGGVRALRPLSHRDRLLREPLARREVAGQQRPHRPYNVAHQRYRGCRSSSASREKAAIS